MPKLSNKWQWVQWTTKENGDPGRILFEDARQGVSSMIKSILWGHNEGYTPM